MTDHIQELNLLMLEITNNERTITEREQKRRIAIEKARVLEREFTNAFILLPDQQAVTGIIFKMVKMIHMWLEKLYVARPEKAKAKQEQEELEKACITIIHFIQKHFPEEFNQHETMPQCLWHPIQEKLDIQWQRIEASKTHATGLIDLIHSIYQLQWKKKESLSYHHATYWETLLDNICTKENTIEYLSDASIITTLIQYNFNHESFTCYFITHSLKEMDPVIPAIQYWTDKLQLVEQIPILSQQGLEQDLLNCKQQIKDLIQKQLISITQENGTVLIQEPKQNELVFHTNLSVPQLAALFRLLVESDILLSTNHKELMRKVSHNFKTNRTTTTISPQHLYDKFYTLESHALNILRTRLMEMVQKSKELDAWMVRGVRG